MTYDTDRLDERVSNEKTRMRDSMQRTTITRNARRLRSVRT